MLICDKCGQTFDHGKFCKNCGGALRDFFTVRGEPGGAEKKCAKCGKTVTGGKFCIYCGSELDLVKAPEPASVSAAAPAAAPAAEIVPTVRLRCDACGSEFDSGKFCKRCGSPLIRVDELEKQPAPEPEVVNVPSQFSPLGQIKPAGPEVSDLTPRTQRKFDINDAPAPKMKCAKCGNIFEKGKFCTVCGGNLVAMGGTAPQTPAVSDAPGPVADVTVPVPEPAEKLPKTAGPAADAPKGMICPGCGKTFEKGKFCTVCGETLVPAAGQGNVAAAEKPADIPAAPAAPAANTKLICVKCGKSFEKGKFCTVCGGDLVGADGKTAKSDPAPAPKPTPVSAAAHIPAPPKPENVSAPISSPTAPPTPPAPSAPADRSSAGQLRCTSCGNMMAKGKFCTVCGGRLEPVGGAPSAPTVTDIGPAAPVVGGKLHCEQCGKTFEKGKFCTVCGGNLVS